MKRFKFKTTKWKPTNRYTANFITTKIQTKILSDIEMKQLNLIAHFSLMNTSSKTLVETILPLMVHNFCLHYLVSS